MNKKVLLSILTATLILGNAMQVSAAEDHATVSFDPNNKLVYSEKESYGDGSAKLGTSFEGIAPGETAKQVITVENNNSRTADFYMDAEAIEALEKRKTEAKGAGYDIKLTSGTDVLYDSTTGGYNSESAEGSKEGIESMNDGALDGYVLIGTLAKGESKDIVLEIVFDGEAMDNTAQVSDYSDAFGQLGFTFKVAYEDPKGPGTVYKYVDKKGQTRLVRKIVEIMDGGVPLGPVQTGDGSMIGIAAVGLVAGVVVVLFANKKKAKTEEKK